MPHGLELDRLKVLRTNGASCALASELLLSVYATTAASISHFETLMGVAVADPPRVASHQHPSPSLCLASLPHPTLQVSHTLKNETLTITSFWRNQVNLQKRLLIRTNDDVRWVFVIAILIAIYGYQKFNNITVANHNA